MINLFFKKQNKNDDNLMDDITYVLNNENIQNIVRAIRQGNYTEDELKFLLKLIKK